MHACMASSPNTESFLSNKELCLGPAVLNGASKIACWTHYGEPCVSQTLADQRIIRKMQSKPAQDHPYRERQRCWCVQVYKRVLDKPVTEAREAGVCMRENDFYVGTVLSFRDRRYEYKGLNKTWKGKLDAAKVCTCFRLAPFLLLNAC